MTTWQLSRVFKAAAIGTAVATTAVLIGDAMLDGLKNALARDMFMVKPWGVYIPIISPWSQAVIDPVLAAWQAAQGQVHNAPNLPQHLGKAITIAGAFGSHKLWQISARLKTDWEVPVSWPQWRLRR